MRPSHLLLLSTLGLASPLVITPPNEILLLPPSNTTTTPLSDLTAALSTLQTTFFSPSTGTYPTGIDWTRAVLGTLLAATTRTLSRSPQSHALSTHYFTHIISHFYGQDVPSLKLQAFDDILWVVLQWLEAVQTISFRAATFPPNTYTGSEWAPTFAARAAEFYSLAEAGWDSTLCGGGMVWSRYLEPYKNAITNELYIAASVGMYLHHPGHNATHLQNARRAYRWLKKSNMQNDHGLYTDGFHISRLGAPPEAGEKSCDKRNEMVYTYNQGVLLSGLRGLADATGERAYLEEGFELVNSVLSSEGMVGEIVVKGVLTEKCDPRGGCSQNGQTFKAIWMHHVTVFCAPLVGWGGKVERWQREGCALYRDFLGRNAKAAWGTRNADGVVGSWWAAPEVYGGEQAVMDAGAVDYLNPDVGTAGGGGGHVGGDLNDRGRGRTVESHAGGLAALRAVVEICV